VNPLALKYKNQIFINNERHVSLLQTENFGKIAYIEVGAIMVGKIVQTHRWNKPFMRGEEKGYFLFGGSTVIVLGEKGAWKPSADIVKNTNDGIETYLQLGQEVAVKA
jgi:phosphatidylserine decarboxylase